MITITTNNNKNSFPLKKSKLKSVSKCKKKKKSDLLIPQYQWRIGLQAPFVDTKISGHSSLLYKMM